MLYVNGRNLTLLVSQRSRAHRTVQCGKGQCLVTNWVQGSSSGMRSPWVLSAKWPSFPMKLMIYKLPTLSRATLSDSFCCRSTRCPQPSDMCHLRILRQHDVHLEHWEAHLHRYQVCGAREEVGSMALSDAYSTADPTETTT